MLRVGVDSPFDVVLLSGMVIAWCTICLHLRSRSKGGFGKLFIRMCVMGALLTGLILVPWSIVGPPSGTPVSPLRFYVGVGASAFIVTSLVFGVWLASRNEEK